MFWHKTIESEEYKKLLRIIVDIQGEIDFLKGESKTLNKKIDDIEITALEFKKKYKTKLTKDLEEKQESKDIYTSVLLPE